jgi:hypothetical protein
MPSFAPQPPAIGLAALDDAALDARLLAGRYRGDPLADRLVAVFAALPGRTGWQMLDAALADGIDAVPDAPPELRALLADASGPPSWLDLDLVDAGAMSFWRAGAPALTLALVYGSLAFGYQFADLSRPLAATGRLERMASRRIGETSRWALAVTTPGGMHPGGAGWCSSVRVRVVHALVRARLLRSDDWDVDAWGTPISATGMMATAIGGFHVLPERAMRDLGVRTTAADREARVALWRWVGAVMGVPAELLPLNGAEAERLLDAFGRCSAGPSEDGTRLMEALVRQGLPLEGILPPFAVGPARLLGAPLISALVRRWIGDPVADELGLGRSPVGRLVPLLRPLVRVQTLALAAGLLGDEQRAARQQIGAIERLLDRAGDPSAPVQPSDAAADATIRVRRGAGRSATPTDDPRAAVAAGRASSTTAAADGLAAGPSGGRFGRTWIRRPPLPRRLHRNDHRDPPGRREDQPGSLVGDGERS